MSTAKRNGAGESAADFLPVADKPSLSELAVAAASCQGCDLYKRGTQTVFGAGSASSELVFIGEQPGDYEDRQGQPFVGPAGRVLDRALAEVGIDRKSVYVTNAVKHFKWEPRGKRRIHSKPSVAQMRACRPWLQAELAAIKPRVVVCLGATAAQSLLGSAFRITHERGKVLENTGWAPYLMATVHPSSILRAPDERSRHAAYDSFVADLQGLVRVLKQQSTSMPRE
jgi:uracil-DNA glycosylase family protein